MKGRPSRFESRLRERALLAHLAAGTPLHEAAQLAKVDPAKVLRLLQDAGFRAAVVVLLDAPAAELEQAA